MNKIVKRHNRNEMKYTNLSFILIIFIDTFEAICFVNFRVCRLVVERAARCVRLSQIACADMMSYIAKS